MSMSLFSSLHVFVFISLYIHVSVSRSVSLRLLYCMSPFTYLSHFICLLMSCLSVFVSFWLCQSPSPSLSAGFCVKECWRLDPEPKYNHIYITLGKHINPCCIYFSLLIYGPHEPGPVLGIRSFAHRSFAQIAQFKWATVRDSLRLLRTNERLRAIRSDCSEQMSDCEGIAQVAHVKRVIRSGH